ncbi:hypothetical protein HFO65_32990 [Rhizobium laguerreae]|uniref:hypothetical protein n=1 Tax=Rhizobium laguerreae TaxID=1076926 RepID=UPI00143F325C|nr:hypothetical protein [Rhizobium laguerreae]MBY3165409.1 hypothetical protein [Rhizobium laguerreae]NKM16211.1 hypothetical protein [Rhizobium laguerreae]
MPTNDNKSRSGSDSHQKSANRAEASGNNKTSALLAAVGHNFRRILAWITFCNAIIWAALALPKASNSIPALG